VTQPIVYTIGHSTRPFADFVHLLKSHGVQRLIDVRTLPGHDSTHKFDRARMPSALEHPGIRYSHVPGLGGLRRARRDSVNTGWRNASFRGYADYMQTDAFKESLEQCIQLASAERVVLMCAEAVPWRCHRSLIADALLARGIQTREIVSEMRARPHSMTPFAQVTGINVMYPAASDGGQASRHPLHEVEPLR
jgi:uncharacterized protein (DUF488 family)